MDPIFATKCLFSMPLERAVMHPTQVGLRINFVEIHPPFAKRITADSIINSTFIENGKTCEARHTGESDDKRLPDFLDCGACIEGLDQQRDVLPGRWHDAEIASVPGWGGDEENPVLREGGWLWWHFRG